MSFAESSVSTKLLFYFPLGQDHLPTYFGMDPKKMEDNKDKGFELVLFFLWQYHKKFPPRFLNLSRMLGQLSLSLVRRMPCGRRLSNFEKCSLGYNSKSSQIFLLNFLSPRIFFIITVWQLNYSWESFPQ